MAANSNFVNLWLTFAFRAMWWTLAAVAGLLYAVARLLLAYRVERRAEVRVEGPMGTARLLLLGAIRSLLKQPGRLAGPVSRVHLVQSLAPLPSPRLARYARASVFEGGRAADRMASRLPTALPPCFPQVLSVGLAPALIVDSGFPLAPLGILHLRQTIRQRGPMPADRRYDVSVHFAQYPGGLRFAETSRGIELTLRVVLRDRDSSDPEPVWEGDTVVVSRAASSGGRRGPPKVFESPQWQQSAVYPIRESTGRTYAAASGDFNPHHLYWWTALPVGFSRPIAHGMWTLAAALNELEAMGAMKADKYPLTVECEFKKPLLMPASVTFGFSEVEKGRVNFGVYDKKNVDPHLIGSVVQ